MSAVRKSGYSALQIVLHWGIAALVLFQLAFGESMTTVVDAKENGDAVSPLDQALGSAHFWVGLAILALVVARVALRLLKGAPEPQGHSLAALAAKLAHGAFYLLLVAMPVTGLLALYVSPDLGDVHAWGKPAFIALIAVHGLAALYHQFRVKDGTLSRMLVPAER